MLEPNQKVSLPRRRIREIYNILTSPDLGMKTQQMKFGWAVASNIDFIEPIIKKLAKMESPSKEYTNTFDKEMRQLQTEMCLKDKDGNAVLAGPQKNIYIFPNPAEFEERVEDLRSKHWEVVDAREEQLEDFEKFLDEEEEIGVYKVKAEYVPEMSPIFLSRIMYFIDGDPSESKKE